MDYYYPSNIADDYYDDEISSCCSAEIEGGVAAVADPRTPVNGCGGALQPAQDEQQHNVGNGSVGGSSDDRGPQVSSSHKHTEHDSKGECHVQDDALQLSRHSGGNINASQHSSIGASEDQNEQKLNPMAALIQHERNRRLGVRSTDVNKEHDPTPKSSNAPAPIAAGVLGNIRGWFGGGGAGSNVHLSPGRRFTHAHSDVSQPLNASSHGPAQRRTSAPVMRGSSHSLNISSHGKRGSEHLPPESPLVKNGSHNTGDDDSSSGSSGEYSSSDDDGSSSQSSNDSNNQHQQLVDADFTPQERARARALRYLSNSCVDAGRKAKTSSYTRGLERLDLKRKRDRYEKELDIVEAEMNKDRGLINGRERDPISAMAAKLVRELPRIQDADAGAGHAKEKSFMSYDEYVNTLNTDESDSGNQQQPTLWDNKEAVDRYVTSLQGRLKAALERTRSFEKRLVVLEQAGDDIVSSLCEDLADVTGHSNKAEARYVKKGKELQRKRRREELRHRTKIKHAEECIRILEEELIRVSGSNESSKKWSDGSDASNGDSTLSRDNDEEDDEITLEKKLSTIKAKSEQDKDQHESEVESIRRQCEQLKLRLSVARLVMEGDDNLREYVAMLERANPGTRKKRSSTDFDEGEDLSFINEAAIPPPPPSRITRARAKLLKVALLEQIYEQRLAVSKAFTDATINALEQELLDREEASQKMEVRCLNELVMIDCGIKDIVDESSAKQADLETEATELEDAIAAFAAQKSISDVNNMFGGGYTPIRSSKPVAEEIISSPLRSIRSRDNCADENDATKRLPDDEPPQAEKYAKDELEPAKLVARGVIPMNNEAFSEKLIEGKVEQDVTSQASDADSLQVESRTFNESSHQEAVQSCHASMEKLTFVDAPDRNGLGLDDIVGASISATIDTNSVDADGTSASSCENEESSRPDVSCEPIEKAVISASNDADSICADDIWRDGINSVGADGTSASSCENAESSQRDISFEPIEKAVISASNDADSICADDIGRDSTEASSCKNMVGDNHVVENFGSSDEALENGYHDQLSDDDSFMHGNDAADKCSMPKPILSSDPDAERVGSTPQKDVSDETHDINNFGSFDETAVNGSHDYKEVDELDSKYTEDASMTPSQNEKKANTEAHFQDMNTDATHQATQTDSEDGIIDSNGTLSCNVGQLKSQPEMHPTDQVRSDTTNNGTFVTEKSSVDLNGDEIDHDKAIEAHGKDVAKKMQKSPPQKKAVLELLGKELKCTLAEYQTEFDLSSSRERVGQLEYMNDLVLKIAKVQGIECPNSESSGEGELTSWSLKKTKLFRRPSEKERHEKKRSKKKKKRRRRGRDREGKDVIIKMDGPDSHDQSLVW